jgi:integrase
VRVRDLPKGRIKAFLAEKLTSESDPLSRNSVRIIHATLRAMLNAALDDGVIYSNPAERLGRSLRLSSAAKHREEEIKAMDAEQLARFLAAAQEGDAGYYALFFTMARTGVRLGEAFALQWTAFDYERRELLVERTLSEGMLGTTKGGRSRRVDMSRELVAALRRLEVQRKEDWLRQGRGVIPPWIFCTSDGTPLDQSAVSKLFKKTLRAAGLPPHYSPHSLRHTFASLLLQDGASPAYVQRQLGHASIQLTVDTYGKWLPMGNKAAADRLDAIDSAARTRLDCSKTAAVAAGGSRASGANTGAGDGIRTRDLLITNQLLYH